MTTTKPDAETVPKLTKAAQRDLLILAEGRIPGLCYGPYRQLIDNGLAKQSSAWAGIRYDLILTEKGRRVAEQIKAKTKRREGVA